MYGNRKTAKKKDGTFYPTYYSYACKHRTYKNGHKCDYHKQWNESKVDEAVAEIIKKLVQNPRFSEVMKTKINTKVDTAEAERELENARKMLRQAEGVKDKIILQLDSLDVLDKNYDRKYEDMQKRLDSSYDKISEAEELISICEEKLYNIQKDKITSTNIYNYLVMFESIYDDLTDMEKKQFYNTLLHEVQVFENEQENGQIVKSMSFKFSVYYNGEFTDTIFRDKKETVETVCVLTRKDRA